MGNETGSPTPGRERGDASPELRILVTGMMASGKSTVGRAVGRLTGWPFVDNDEVVRSLTGRSASEVLAASGEVELRRVERAALDVVLEMDAPVVGGVAGGVIEDPEARRKMAEGAFVVHLRAPLELLAERIRGDESRAGSGDGDARPWIHGDVLEVLRRLHRGRADLYESTADLVVDVAGRDPDEIAAEIVSAIRGDRR